MWLYIWLYCMCLACPLLGSAGLPVIDSCHPGAWESYPNRAGCKQNARGRGNDKTRGVRSISSMQGCIAAWVMDGTAVLVFSMTTRGGKTDATHGYIIVII